MMSTNQGFSLSFPVLVALVALALVGCGGDEPAPPPPPPAPPPAPPFVPQDVAIDLGSSGETLTLQTTEAGGFTRNGEAFSSGTEVEAAGNTYRLTLESGTWSAAYEAPNPWAVPLGRSGEALLITRREDGLYEGSGSVFESGGIVMAANGNQYMLTFADDRWTSAYLAPEPVPVGLGTSGEVVLVGRTEGGSYQVGGQSVVSGSIVRSSAGTAYRLVMQDGAWTATFEPPPPVVVSLGTSGQIVVLQLDENGNYLRDGRLFASGTTVEVGGETFQLTLQNGQWTAISQAPVLQMVTLGTSAVTLTLQRSSGGGWTEDGEQVRNGDVRRVGNNRYRLLLEDGEWSAEYLRSTIPVEIPGGLILLYQEEDGTLTHDGDRVSDGSVITQDGRTYELLLLSDGTWLATPGAPPPAAADQTVSLPGSGRSITLTRRDDGSYAYENAAVTDGRVIRVGGVDYRLNRNAQGVWSAVAITGTGGTINPGTVGGPTQTDEVSVFTESRFDDSGTTNDYGVRFTRRGSQTLYDRGTKIVPLRLLDPSTATTIAEQDNPYEFSVYDLMQQGLAPYKRTFVEVARAKLEEIVNTIQLQRDDYAADAKDPDTEIAEGGALWDQARLAVARIFGHTDLSETVADEVLGSDPWTGQRLDVDEVDDVIAALQDTIGVLSDSARFAREFEIQIDDVNGSSGTYTARDFFEGDMYRIRFGSTNSTRFGAYAVKISTDSVTAHAAIDGMWEPGVFAYTPIDEPDTGDIPTRGEATFSGNTVAVSAKDAGDDPPLTEADLYAGKIELVASFTRKRVSGTVTELKDEGGDTFEYESGFGKEAVSSISLASALLDSAEGLYKAAATDQATLFFRDNLPSESDTTDTAFTVQLVDEATEALGVWKAFGLEGSFGATRSGNVAKPTLPAEADRGGKAVLASIHVITDGAAAVSGSTTSEIITPDDDDNSQLTLDAATLGLARGTPDSDAPPIVTQVEFDRDFPTTLKLTDLYRSRSRNRRSSNTIASRASAEILKVRNLLAHDSDMTGVEAILDAYFGFDEDLDLKIDSPTLEARTNETDDQLRARQETADRNARRAVADAVRTALGSESRFRTGLAADGIFTGSGGAAVSGWDDDRIRRAVTERRWDFALRFAKTKYTRFGVWSQIAPQTAGAEVTPEEGSFAYSPLGLATDISLSFAATYSGTTLAVNEKTGHLYSGKFDLSVNWESGSSGNRPIRSTITDLKGVHGTTAYFKHDNKDVKSLFFTDVGVDQATGTITDTVATVTVNYRTGSSRNVDLTSGGEMAGAFVMDAIFEDEPVGVLGVWSIPEVSGMNDAFTGSFGADLVP